MKFLVTVNAVGCIVIDAPDAETAKRYVNENVTMERMILDGSFSDDSPVATDAEPEE